MKFIDRKNIIRNLLLALSLFIIGLFACSKEEKAEIVNQENLVFPDQEGWHSSVFYSTNGVVTAQINYGHMQRFKKRNVVDFDKGIVIDFYDEKGKHTSKLTSNKGKLNEASSGIEAFGNVVVVSDSGINLQTEHLWWDNSIEKVMSDEFVTITTLDNDTLYGYGFESDQYLNNWEIKVHSGKAGRGFDLDLGSSRRKSKSNTIKKDSTSIDSTVIMQDTTFKTIDNGPR